MKDGESGQLIGQGVVKERGRRVVRSKVVRRQGYGGRSGGGAAVSEPCRAAGEAQGPGKLQQGPDQGGGGSSKQGVGGHRGGHRGGYRGGYRGGHRGAGGGNKGAGATVGHREGGKPGGSREGGNEGREGAGREGESMEGREGDGKEVMERERGGGLGENKIRFGNG